MINWYKAYHGTTDDPKFAVIARRAGARLCEVLTVWQKLLECASSQLDRGGERGDLTGFDAEIVDVCLELEDGTTQRIIDAMTAKGMIADGRLANWDKRQVVDVNSHAERQRRYREKNKLCSDASAVTDDAQMTPSDAPTVTGDAQVTPSDAPAVTGDAQVTPSDASTVTGDAQVTPSDASTVTDDARLKTKDFKTKDFKTDQDDEDLARARESKASSVVGEGNLQGEKAHLASTGGTMVTLNMVAGLWREILEPLGFPAANTPDKALYELFCDRVHADPARESLGWWRNLFERIGASKFLRHVAANGAPQTGARWITLAWVLKCGKDGIANIDKIIAGRFDSSGQSAVVPDGGGREIPKLEDAIPEWCKSVKLPGETASWAERHEVITVDVEVDARRQDNVR